jgi:accessory gene regulator B
MDLNLNQKIITYLSVHLKLNQDQKEIALYGLQLITYAIVDLLLIIMAAWWLKALPATLILISTTALLRNFAGGAHSGSPVTCAILGMIVSPGLGKLAMIAAPLMTLALSAGLLTAGWLVSLAINWRLAPVDSPAKPINDPVKRHRFKIISVSIVLMIGIIQLLLLIFNRRSAYVLAISFGLWWQTFTLTQIGHRFATLLDKIQI